MASTLAIPVGDAAAQRQNIILDERALRKLLAASGKSPAGHEVTQLVGALRTGTAEQQMALLFKLHATDAVGAGTVVDAATLAAMLQAGCEAGVPGVCRDVVSCVANRVVEELGCHAPGIGLTRDEFLSITHAYPALAQCMTGALRAAVAPPPVTGAADETQPSCCAVTGSVVWRGLSALLRVVLVPFRPHNLFITAMYLALCGMFVWGALDNVTGLYRDIMGPTYVVARGCAYVIKLAFAFLLCTACIRSLTFLRTMPLRHVIPFDRHVNVHKQLGIIIGVASFTHMFCHFVDFQNAAGPQSSHHWAAAGAPQPTLRDLYAMPVSITGFVMIGTMMLAAPFALPWPRKSKWLAPTPLGRSLNHFSAFHWTHQLLWLSWVICLYAHPYAGLPHHLHTSRTWIFISGPLLLYVIERTVRLLRRNVRAGGIEMEVLAAVPLPGATTRLIMRVKPSPTGAHRSLCFLPGQYALLSIPSLSMFQWHPFTFSSAPGDQYVTMHIRALGSWTRKLHEVALRVHAQLESMHLDKALGATRAAAGPMGMRAPVSSGRVALTTAYVRHMRALVSTAASKVGAALAHKHTPGSHEVHDGSAPSAVIISAAGGCDNDVVVTVAAQARVACVTSAAVYVGMTQEARKELEATGAAPLALPRVWLDGPLGSPSQLYQDYDVLLLVAGGIGATPFASILAHVASQMDAHRCNHCGEMNLPQPFWLRKLYFHWSVRVNSAHTWFLETLADVAAVDSHHMVDLAIHYTSGTPAVLASQMNEMAATATGVSTSMGGSPHAASGTTTAVVGAALGAVTPGTRSHTATSYGRPDWEAVVGGVATAHPDARIGVMFCGPQPFGAELQRVCKRVAHPSLRFRAEIDRGTGMAE